MTVQKLMHRLEVRDASFYGGRDPKNLRKFIPLAPEAFALTGQLGTWVFVKGKDGHITSRWITGILSRSLHESEPLVCSGRARFFEAVREESR